MRGAAAAMFVLLAASAGRAAPVEVEVRGLRLDAESGSPVVQLAEKQEGGRTLPIWVGPFEAQAIALELHGVPLKRPQTHDLMAQLLERVGVRVGRVLVEDLREGTYFARLELVTADGKTVTVDARPSDAIALALRLRGPIFVEEQVFDKASAAGGGNGGLRVWGLMVQDLTPELAPLFALPGTSGGVLVADVTARGPASGVARGDVITALDGTPVATAADLVRRAGVRSDRAPVSLVVQRAGKRLTVTFPVEIDNLGPPF